MLHACNPTLRGLRQANHRNEFQDSLVYRLRFSVSKHTAIVIYIHITLLIDLEVVTKSLQIKIWVFSWMIAFLFPLFGGVSHKAGILGISREELHRPV